MSRLFQLLMPALSAVLVGLFVFDSIRPPRLFDNWGGLFVLGLYMLCIAAALAAVGTMCIDTTSRPATGVKPKKRRRMLDIARQPDRLARAYVQMYTIPFLPIALFTFGTGILVSVMLHGIADEMLAVPEFRSSSTVPGIIMAGWLVVMSLGLAAWRSRQAAFGCAAGIALAALAGEFALSGNLDALRNLSIWGLGLVILAVLILVVGALFRRRSAHRVEPA